MAKFTTIIEAFDSQMPRHTSTHLVNQISRVTDLGYYNRSLKERNEKATDEYPINHPLNPAEMRILLKILNKEYEDCGRKRGAILRYIEHYKDKEPKLGDKLLIKLRQFKNS